MVKELTWKIDGEFLTKLARDRLYHERQPYSKVEQFLLECLHNDSIAVEDTKYIIRQILSCKKKLVGINHFSLEDDNDSYIGGFDLSTDNLVKTIFQLKDQLIQLNRQNRDLEQELDETRYVLKKYEQELNEVSKYLQKIAEESGPIGKLKKHLTHSSVVDIISWKSIWGRNPGEDDKKCFNDFCEQYDMYPGRSVRGDWEWIQFYDKKTDELLTIDDFKKRGIVPVQSDKAIIEDPRDTEVPEEFKDEELDYGFLTPTGKFIKGPWGSHTELAYNIIDANGWTEEFYQWNYSDIRSSSDFLVQCKHHILLHCPSGFGRIQVTRSEGHRLTKAQKEFLYDYLMKDGQDILANYIMMEE